MLKLHEWNDTDKHMTVLNNASDVCISQELNKSYRLSFTYPNDEKGKLITVNRLINCEGQLFRILRVRHSNDGQNEVNVTCDHVYYADGRRVFMESFGAYTSGGTLVDFVNMRPSRIADYAFDHAYDYNYGRISPFTVLQSISELKSIGMQSIDLNPDETTKFTTDFFVTDKRNPVDLMEDIIENIGKGEIYVDNYTVALVERIGKDNGVRLELDRNLESVTVERDITDMVTRLYPYGPDDLHIGSATTGNVHYIDSPNISQYGIITKHKNYEDIEGQGEADKAFKLKRMAEWEFSSQNDNRIDVPTVSITGRLVDISKLEDYGDVYKVGLGDTVTVIDNGTEIKERIIAIDTYPYEPKRGSITIGKVQKNLYFYMDQLRYRVNKLVKGR